MKTREQAYELIYAAIDKSARQGASDEGSNETVVRNTALDLLNALEITDKPPRPVYENPRNSRMK